MTTELAPDRRVAGCPLVRPFDRPFAGTSTPVSPRIPAAFGRSWERTTPPLAEFLAARQLAGPRENDAHRDDRDNNGDREGERS